MELIHISDFHYFFLGPRLCLIGIGGFPVARLAVSAIAEPPLLPETMTVVVVGILLPLKAHVPRELRCRR